MQLTHYCRKPFDLNRDVSYTQKIDWKPGGLWLSDDSSYGWKQWCIEEDFIDMDKQKAIHFNVDMQYILHLSTFQQVIDFDKEYTKTPDEVQAIFDTLPDELLASMKSTLSGYIHWPRVAKEYDGILISPYSRDEYLNWKFGDRMNPLNNGRNLMVYNAWDCASACVWNLNCLEIQPA